MELKLDEKMLKDVLAATLVQVLPPERTRELLEEGIKAVLEKREQYNAIGALERIFRDVVEAHVKKVAADFIATNAELQAKLEQLTRSTILESFESVKTHIGTTVAKTLENALTGKRW